MKRRNESEVPLDFGLDVARGLYPNVSWVNKFAANPLMDAADPATDVWEYGKTQPDYIFPLWGTAPIDTISSDDASDAVDITLQGLDIDGNAVEQIATLDGLNKVILDTPLWRINRAFNADINLTTGQGTSLVGNTYIYEDTPIVIGIPTDTDKVRGLILDGNNQTQMGIYTVPLGLTGYFRDGGAGLLKDGGGVATSAIMQLRMRVFGGAFRVQKTVTVGTAGSSSFQERRTINDPHPPLTDILTTCKQVTTNGSSIWTSFEIILINEVAEAK